MSDNFPTVESKVDTDWAAIHNLFEEFECEIEEFDMSSFLAGVYATDNNVEILLRVEDDHGWDDVMLLPNGTVIFPDRNNGTQSKTRMPVIDVAKFVADIIAKFKQGG